MNKIPSYWSVILAGLTISSCSTNVQEEKYGLGFVLPPDPPSAVARVKTESDIRSSEIAAQLYARLKPYLKSNNSPFAPATMATTTSAGLGMDSGLVRELEWLEPDAAAKLEKRISQTENSSPAILSAPASAPTGGLGGFWKKLIGKKTEVKDTGAGSEKGWRKEMTSSNRTGQGGCGSCWAFSLVRVIETNYHRKYGSWLDLSEEDLVASPFRSKIDGHVACCCGGEWFDAPLKWIRSKGLATESTIPYKMKDLEMGTGKCHDSPECVYKTDVPRTKGIVADWRMIAERPTDAQLKDALLKHGPLAVGFVVPQGIFGYSSGIIKRDTPPLLDQNGNIQLHAVVLVGFDDTKGAWLVLNSWGKWGQGGYGWIEYGGHSFGMSATAVFVGSAS